MRVLFCQPVNDLLEPSVHIRMCYVEPLGIEYLAAATEAVGHEALIEYPVIADSEIVEAVRRERPDAVAVSIYSYAFPEAVRWAHAIKSVAPQTVLIAGGHHPTAEPQDVLDAGFDYVVIGEGEQSLVELLSALRSGHTPELPAGVAAIRGGKMHRGQARQRISPLEALPWPTRLPHILADAKNFQVIDPPPSRQLNLAQVTYSRGCPNNCAFCSSAQMWRRKVVWRDPANVLDEVEHLADTYGTNVVYFPDLELNASPKRLHDLCDEFQRRGNPLRWWGLFALHGLDAELLKHLLAAGCVKLSLGVEAVGDEALARLCAGKAPRWEDVLNTFQTAHSIGLITRVFLMIGNAEDTPGYYEDLCAELPHLAADDMRVSFTTPFPGTDLYRTAKAAGTLAVTDLAQYTTEKPILFNPTMDAEQMLEWRQKIIDVFYSNTLYAERTRNRIKRWPSLRSSYLEYYDRLLATGSLGSDSMEKVRFLVDDICGAQGVKLEAMPQV